MGSGRGSIEVRVSAVWDPDGYFIELNQLLGTPAVLIAAALLLGQWACTRTAQNLGVADPGAIVWDEVVAFWLVLWLVMPAGLVAQVLAFGLFRFFDAVKPGPVGWADRLFHHANPAATADSCAATTVART